MGMLNNPWFRIKVHHQVRRSQINASDDVDEEGVVVVGGVGVVTGVEEGGVEEDYISDATFEHPTLPGALSGGWMQAMKEHPALTAPGVFINNDDSNSSSGDNEVKTTDEVATVAPPAYTSIDPSIPTFTLEEVEQHNNKDSTWIVVKGRVYDCTPFLKAHPGGAESILIMAGQEATEDFEAVHSKKAWKMLEEYFIGVVGVGVEEVGSSSSTSVSKHHHIDDILSGNTSSSIEEKASYRDVDDDSNPTILNPKQRIKLPLVSRVDVSHDSILLRFGLPSPKHILGLPVGQHMLCYAKVEDKLVMR
jgi:nitrate reductase (NAD(P)H)